MVEWKKLGEICYISDYVSNGSFASLRKNVEYKTTPDYAILVRVVDYSNGFDRDKFVYIDEKAYNFLAKSSLEGGEIIMSNVGSCGLLFRCPQLDKKMSLAPNAILIKSQYIDYLYYWLGSNMGQEEIKKITSHSAMPKFNKTEFKKIPCPIPSISEQTRIVGILDTFTSAIDNLKAQIALRRKQYEYYRDQLLDLEGKDGVERKKLGDVCGIFDGTHQTPKYTDSGIRFVSVENINSLYDSEKYISTEDFNAQYKTKPQKGDVLMTRIGDVGTCAVINREEPIAYYVSLALLKPNKDYVINFYIKYILESRIGKIELRKRTLLTAVPLKINLGDVCKITIPIPSLSEQQRIVSILDTFEASIQNLEAQLKQREKQYEYYRNKLLTFE